MGYLIRNVVGGASFVVGLICFFFSSIYDNSFGKLGSGGFLVYLGISLSIFYLIWGFKRIRVPETEGFQIVVQTTLFVAICLISVEFDILVPGKSDALGIVSYGLFALMSLSKSRRSELGFETGFFSFFLSLFSEQLFKTNRKLLPIALVFCLAAILLRHRSKFASPNGDRPEDVASLLTDDDHESSDVEVIIFEVQYPSGVGELEVSVESLSSANSQQNNPDESSQVAHQSLSDSREVLQESILEVVRDSQQNNDQEEPRSSFPVESSYSSEQDHVSPGNNQNGRMHSSPPPQLLRRRGMRMTPAIPNISSSLGDTLRRWHPPHLFFFFFSNPR